MLLLSANGAKHNSLGQRPRCSSPRRVRAESPTHSLCVGPSALDLFPSPNLGLRPRLIYVAPLALRVCGFATRFERRFIMMPHMMTIKKMMLSQRHLLPGRTTHTISDSRGQRPFAAFTSLAITQYPGEDSCYLMHICADGSVADTWHESVADAIHQAEWELGVDSAEWVDTNEPF